MNAATSELPENPFAINKPAGRKICTERKRAAFLPITFVIMLQFFVKLLMQK